jgi:hypothetical protein
LINPRIRSLCVEGSGISCGVSHENSPLGKHLEKIRFLVT